MKRLTLLALVLTFAACDSETGPEFTDPDDLRLEIVSGDGQVAPVQTTDGASIVEASLVAQVGAPSGVLPDTLVARIRDKSGGHANVPPNTVVNYVVPTDGCGEPWINAASPDDSAYVATLWERPAGQLPDLQWHGDVWGALCTLETRTVVDGVFKTDTTFQAIFTTGPLTNMTTGSVPIELGDTVDLRFHISEGRDVYRNVIPVETIRGIAASDVTWQWRDGHPDGTWARPEQTGWLLVAPTALDTAAMVSRRQTYTRPDPQDPDDMYFDALVYEATAVIAIAGDEDARRANVAEYYCLDGSPRSSHPNGCP